MLSRAIIFSGLFFGFILPIHTKYSNIILIVFYFLTCLLVVRDKLIKPSIWPKYVFLSTILLVIPIVVSFFFFGMDVAIIKMLGRRITLLLSPLIIFLLPKEVVFELKNKAAFGLILGSSLSSVYLIFTVLKRYFFEKGGIVIDNDLFNYYHTNANFMSNIDIHPSYYGMYVLISLFSLYILRIFKNQFLKNCIGLVFLVSLIFLNSRILLFLSFLFVLWMILKELLTKIKTNRHRLISVFTGLIILMGLFFILKNTYVYHKFTKELVWDLSNEVGTNFNTKNQGDSRVARWKTALDLVKEKPLFGYGAGNETKTLKKEYLVREMVSSASFEYNSHNQYLTTLLEGGIFAFLLFIAFFILNLCLAWKKSDIFFLFFLISIGVICLVESYLNRNAGISFFSFFSTILLVNNVYSNGSNS